MDLITVRSFRDPKSKITLANQQHKCHVPQGARFSMGAAKTLKELTKHDRPTAEFVAALILADCIAEATPENIARVEAELEVERRRLERAADANSKAGISAVAAQFQALLEQVARAMPATRAR